VCARARACGRTRACLVCSMVEELQSNIIRDVDFYRCMHNIAGYHVLFQLEG